MSSPWLVLDCNYLCHRAFHTTGDLEHGGIKTGVIFGFIRDLLDLVYQWNTSNVIFCFDSRTSVRKELYTPYKANRHKDDDPEAQALREELFKQIVALRKDYLPHLGFRNIFIQKGYEADDLIGALCAKKKRPPIIVVSSDHDLYQLLSIKTKQYDPFKKQTMTTQKFVREYGVGVSKWAWVKACAGCTSDNVEGIAGVGEKTAIKFLRKELKDTTKAYEKIIKGGHIIERNLILTTLPFPGTKRYKIKPDEMSKTGWKKVMKSLGMGSFKQSYPFDKRKMK